MSFCCTDVGSPVTESQGIPENDLIIFLWLDPKTFLIFFLTFLKSKLLTYQIRKFTLHVHCVNFINLLKTHFGWVVMAHTFNHTREVETGGSL